MKVLLTGATGYIGSGVAAALKAAGHEVVALVRSAEAQSSLKANGFSPVRGDVKDVQHLAALARDVDGVIHAASTNDASNPAVDAALTRALLNALEGSGKPFVYTSGVWSLGDTGATVADESWPCAHPLPLVAWRVPVEDEVLAAARKGVRSVVMRPSIVYGAGGGIPGMLVAEAKAKGVVRVVGDGSQEWPLVHRDDLAALYVRALETAAPGTLLHAGAGPSVRLSDLATAASVAGGAGGKTAAWPLEEARKEFGGFADALALSQRVSNAKARHTFGWTPRAPGLIEELLVGSYRE